jgi:hypothetical protein
MSKPADKPFAHSHAIPAAIPAENLPLALCGDDKPTDKALTGSHAIPAAIPAEIHVQSSEIQLREKPDDVTSSNVPAVDAFEKVSALSLSFEPDSMTNSRFVDSSNSVIMSKPIIERI